MVSTLDGTSVKFKSFDIFGTISEYASEYVANCVVDTMLLLGIIVVVF